MRLIDADALKKEIREKDPFGGMNYEWYIDHAPTIPTASPWHRVEDGLPEMSELIPRFVCSGVLVLYDAESGYTDIGYVREKPDGVDWMWGKPHKNPTHWMHFEPPKEDA